MSDTAANLRRKIAGAGDLQSVVRTMKAVAASRIGQFEKSVRALADYNYTIELGLGACFRDRGVSLAAGDRQLHGGDRKITAVVFGSDQGLIGRFNDVVTDYTVKILAPLSGELEVWAVGERARSQLADAGLTATRLFAVPSSVQAIAPLIGQILVGAESHQYPDETTELRLFYNRPVSGATYAPVSQRLLPLDGAWARGLLEQPWPTHSAPEITGSSLATFRALVREYLFVSLFRACAESLSSENASRLAAMQRADRNIEDLLEDLTGRARRFRQSSIDEELFDVIAGFEALRTEV